MKILRTSVILPIFIAIAMAVFALIVISYAGAKDAGASANLFHYFKMQLIFVILSVFVVTIVAHVNYRIYKTDVLFWTIIAMTLISLLLVLVPGIGVSVKGSQRWIGLGSLRLQPVEFVKLAVVMVMSAHMDRIEGLVNTFRWKVILPPAILLAGATIGLALQPDYGGTAIVCLLAGLMLLIGGWGWKKCLALGLIGITAIALLVLTNENRMRRLQNESSDSNYQAAQSEIAFRNGGLLGQGLGKGMQRQGYLPECHTDFIFSIIGEDYGLVGTGLVWMGFILILGCGTVISFYAPDKQGMLLAFGATMVICAQAVANMAVVTHLIPTKGLALPFFSYGGSSLLSSSIALGFIINVGRETLAYEENHATTTKTIHSL